MRLPEEEEVLAFAPDAGARSRGANDDEDEGSADDEGGGDHGRRLPDRTCFVDTPPV